MVIATVQIRIQPGLSLASLTADSWRTERARRAWRRRRHDVRGRPSRPPARPSPTTSPRAERAGDQREPKALVEQAVPATKWPKRAATVPRAERGTLAELALPERGSRERRSVPGLIVRATATLLSATGGPKTPFSGESGHPRVPYNADKTYTTYRTYITYTPYKRTMYTTYISYKTYTEVSRARTVSARHCLPARPSCVRLGDVIARKSSASSRWKSVGSATANARKPSARSRTLSGISSLAMLARIVAR